MLLRSLLFVRSFRLPLQLVELEMKLDITSRVSVPEIFHEKPHQVALTLHRPTDHSWS